MLSFLPVCPGNLDDPFTTIGISTNSAALPPPLPDMVEVLIPFLLAYYMALIAFLELPDPDKQINKLELSELFDLEKFFICSVKT